MKATINNKGNMPGTSFLALLFIALLLLAGCASGREEAPPLPAPATVVQEQAQTTEVEVALEEQQGVESLDEEQQKEKNQVLQEELSEVQQIPTSDTPVSTMEETTTNTRTVWVTIRSIEELPDIITDQPVAWEPGDTVLDLLIRTTREHGIHLSYRGRGKTGYVEGINNLYEFDNGPASGWVYSVNGVFPDRSAGGWEVAEGDSIIWWYTLDAGRDVGVFSP